MDVRLVQLLGSFITARSEYALARLEFALHFPEREAPPLIDRMLQPSERALREEWPHLEAQLESALAYLQVIGRSQSSIIARDEGYRRLELSLRELDQYARAIRWVMTVSERA